MCDRHGCRARVCLMVLLLGTLTACADPGQEEFPSRPIDVITHASPGGGTDTTARAMLIGTKQALKADMAVVPKIGGGGAVAMNYVNNQPRDGYTVMGITPTHLFAIARGQGPLKIGDLVAIVRAAEDPIVVMVSSQSEIKTLEDLIELGRKRPIKWGAAQIGGIDHVAGAALARASNTRLSVVPFSGGGEIVTNLMGGNIDAAGLNLTEALDQIRRGDFRALAVMRDSRLDTLKEIPTTVELGYDVTFSTVRGYVALKGTPKDRLHLLEEGMLKGLEHPSFQNYLKGVDLDPGSIAGSEIWAAQIDRLYQDAQKEMIELGIIKE